MTGFTPETKEFYDETGWRIREGRTVDAVLFGDHETGPLRATLQRRRLDRVRAALQQAGAGLRLIEAGCGGNPSMGLLDLCSHYTGVDISTTGLQLAEERLRDAGVPFVLREADVCDLPFEDESFDAAYSAHVIYHIRDPEAQRAAFREIARVVRSSGVAVFVLANPLPLLFPIRVARRLAATNTRLSGLLDGIRRKPPLPYRPMPLGWMREQLAPFGEVSIACYALESVWFNQHVSERRGLGRLLWRAAELAERRHAHRLTRLGNFVQIVLRKA
jgi:SAM-dependent methyltransferase